VDGFEVVEFDLPYANRDSFLKRSWTFLRFALRSIGLAMTRKYDLVFATSTPLTVGIPGMLSRLVRRKRFVFEVRDLWPELPREMGVISNPFVLRAMDWLEWASYQVADGCIGLSPGIVNGIKRRGVDPGKVTMIPNGCDLNLFGRSGPRMRPNGVDEKDFMAIYAGAHGIANGLDAVLDAARELKDRKRKDIKLVFVGDGKLKPILVRRASVENLDNCLFLDPIPKRELTPLLRGANLGLMILANVPAFYYGTSPNKFFDYIASGLPVLNNYPGWLTDMIRTNKCGLPVTPGCAHAFADGLQYLADNRRETEVMGRNARELAESEFDRKALADRFVEFLELIECK